MLYPCKGELIKFEKKEHYDKIKNEGIDINKVKSKLKIETIELKDVMSIYSSFRYEFINKN